MPSRQRRDGHHGGDGSRRRIQAPDDYSDNARRPSARAVPFPLRALEKQARPTHSSPPRHDEATKPGRDVPDLKQPGHRSRRYAARHSLGVLPAYSSTTGAELPYGARTLSRWDFAAFEPLFAYYLDLQKQLQLADLDEHEVRGRWKSFLGKWNRGELAEGWYAPDMFLQVVRLRAMSQADDDDDGGDVGLGITTASQVLTPPLSGRSVPHSAAILDGDDGDGESTDSDDDDKWGPTLPPPGGGGLAPDVDASHAPRHGPGMPKLQDIDARRELDEEDRQAGLDDLRLARKADRAQQKERLGRAGAARGRGHARAPRREAARAQREAARVPRPLPSRGRAARPRADGQRRRHRLQTHDRGHPPPQDRARDP